MFTHLNLCLHPNVRPNIFMMLPQTTVQQVYSECTQEIGLSEQQQNTKYQDKVARHIEMDKCCKFNLKEAYAGAGVADVVCNKLLLPINRQ